MDYAAFLVFIALFIGIGLLSARYSDNEAADFLLAGRSVSPVLTALSAASTKYSGYMFIGLIGYLYTFGLSGIWLAAGFFFGDLVAYILMQHRIREAAAKTGALTFGELVSRWHGDENRVVRFAVGLLTLVFLSTYAAAQLGAGGKALEVLFGWPALSGAFAGAGMILIYCWVGGLRASIWTDAGQSMLMMAAMWLLVFIVVDDAGGVRPLMAKLDAVSSTYMDPGIDRFGGFWPMALFAFGWLFNGIGVVGQPQVMVRFMALDQRHRSAEVALYYFTWSAAFLVATVVVGLATHAYIPNAAGFDAELALPTLAKELLPGLAVGIVVGGIFAASLSTADSQVLSSAAVLSDDYRILRGHGARRLATLLVVCVALAIAIFASANVFTLVIFSWSALACSIGPLVILQSFGQPLSQRLSLTMMAVGLGVALIWRWMALNENVYEGLPGMTAAFAVWFLAQFPRWLGRRTSSSEQA